MTLSLLTSSDWFVGQLVDVSLKSLLLAIVAGAMMWALGVRSATVRHRVWTAVMVGMLLMPLVVPWTIAVPLPTWAYPDWRVAEESEVLGVDVGPMAAVPLSEPVAAAEKLMIEPAAAMPDQAATTGPVVEADEELELAAPPHGPWRFIVGGYLLGVALLGSRLLAGLFAARRLVSSARRIDGPRLPAGTGLATPVYESTRVRVPITVGWLRPAIVLPQDWSTWDAAMLDAVLAHERAHVRRGDLWVALLARVNSIVNWFHPLAWFLSGRLTSLAESACDDAVIDSLGDRTGYARHLLSVATRLSGAPRRLEPVGVAMAARPAVEQRIEAILDDRRPLARRVGWVGTLLLVVAITPAILLAAGITAESESNDAVDVGELVVEAIDKTEERTGVDAKPQAVVGEAEAKPVVRGRVVMESDGSLVPGAEVRLVTWNEGRTRFDTQKVTSDDLGEFEFKNFTPGSKELVAYFKEMASRKSRYKGEPVELAADGKTFPLFTLKLAEMPRIVVHAVNAADDKPVAVALVHLVWSDGERDQRTDANGEATMTRLSHEVWHVEVKAKGFAQQVQAINLADAETARVTFELAPGAALAGTVRDEAGKPVADAGISVFPADFHGGQIEYLTTDGAGKFRFDYLPVSKGLLLMISKDGFVDAREPVTLEAAGDASGKLVDLVLKKRPHGGTVTGTVTDKNGKPIAGATLRNEGMSSDEFRTATTGANGEFTVDDAFEGPQGHKLIVKAKDFSPQRVSFKPGTREQPSEVVVTLEPGHRVHGRVVDVAGAPIRDVRVAAANGNNSEGFEYGQTETTDAEGRFTFDSLPAGAPFAFSKDGYSELEDQSLALDGDEEVVVTMDSAAVIRGLVVDAASGEPVTTVNVKMTFSPDRKAGEPGSHLSGARATSPEGERFVSKDGEFVLRDLVRGMPLQVTVAAEGYDRMTLRRVVARPEEDAETVEFRLARVKQDELFEIQGRIVDRESRPIAAAELRLIVAEKRSFPRDAFPFNWQMIQMGQAANNDGVQQFLSTTSDRDGNFVFSKVLPGKDIELAYWGEGVSQGRVEHLERLTPAERKELTVTVVTPGAIRGEIDRKALPDVTAVTLMPRQGARGGSHQHQVASNETEYEIRNVPPGSYQLQIYGEPTRSKEGGEYFETTVIGRHNVEIASGETLTFDLGAEPAAVAATVPAVPVKKDVEPEAAPVDELTAVSETTSDRVLVRGRVVDTEGRPVAGARMWLPVGINIELNDANFAETATDEQGAFTLSVPRKWLKRDASAPLQFIWCYAPGKSIATASAYQVLRRNSTKPIPITLPPASDTGFTVTDHEGKPLAGARVEPWHFLTGAYDIVPTALREIIGSEADGEGRVNMFAMPREGFSSVQVTADGYGTQQQRIGDAASEPAVRNIQLRATGRIAGRLASEDAKAIAHVRIHVYQEDFQGEHTAGTATVRTDEAGKFTVDHFAEGPIQLIVQSDEKLPVRPKIPEKLEVFAGATTNVSIPMVAGVPVRGVVRAKEGHRPVPGALVSVNFGSFHQSDRVRTDESGRFEATVLPGPVRQQLIIRPEEFSRWTEEKAGWEVPFEVAAGAGPVELPPIELVETIEHRGRLIDKAGQPVANGRLSAVVGNRNLAMAMTDDRGEFGIWLPKLPAVDSYNVHISRDDPRYEVIILDEDPLVLQLER